MTQQLPTSFYIPRIRTTWTEQQIASEMFMQGIGIINRVDFGDFAPAEQKFTRSAFVHFDSFDPQNEAYFASVFEHEGKIKIHVGGHGEYWFLLENKNPVPKTHLNIHQLAENYKKQEEKIAMLEETLNAVIEHLVSLHSILSFPEFDEVPAAPRKQRMCQMDLSEDLQDIATNLDESFLAEEKKHQYSSQEDEHIYGELDEDEYADMPDLIECNYDN